MFFMMMKIHRYEEVEIGIYTSIFIYGATVSPLAPILLYTTYTNLINYLQSLIPYILYYKA